MAKYHVMVSFSDQNLFHGIDEEIWIDTENTRSTQDALEKAREFRDEKARTRPDRPFCRLRVVFEKEVLNEAHEFIFGNEFTRVQL